MLETGQSDLLISGVPSIDIHYDSNHSVLCFVLPLLTNLMYHVLETASLEQWAWDTVAEVARR